MAKKALEDQIVKFSEFLKDIPWPDIETTKDKICIKREKEITILERKDNKYNLNFVWYDNRKNEYNVTESGLSKLTFSEDIDLSSLIYLKTSSYKWSYGTEIKGILQISSGGSNYGKVETLEIDSKAKKLSLSTKDNIFRIPSKKFFEIQADAKEISKRSYSYSEAVSRYLTNKFSQKHLNKKTKATTSIEKGEFDFLIHRFNLETKKKKADFDKYLGKADVGSIQSLVTRLIKEEVFDEKFLYELDEYFIREKLRDIISLGREILALKSSDMSTADAQKVILKLSNKKEIKQLETLWQRFFEKYLLYLIFSYKEVYPKIELTDLETDKKYPDFLGINHYNGIDVIEIKTHLLPALTYDKSHKNFSFSSDMSKAIIQTVNYLDAIKQKNFKNSDDREKITETTHEENLYRPRGIIIISSDEKLSKNNKDLKNVINRDFTKLRNSLHSIEILTFDEILNIADNYCKNIVKK